MKDKKFLIIDSRPYGLFSIFLHTIDNLKWAEDNNYIPVVRWGPGRTDVNEQREGAETATRRGHPKYVGTAPNFLVSAKNEKTEACLYHSEEGYNDTKNPWEYYFKPVSSSTVEEATAATHSISDIFQVGFHDLDPSSLGKKFLIYNLHSYTPLNLWAHMVISPEFETQEEYHSSALYEHRKQINDYIEKYVKIREEISNKIDSFADKYFTKNVLGVHIRGTDKKSESVHGQRPFVTIEDYLIIIQEYIEKNSDAVIFVASDNNEAIKRIFQRFPDNRIIVYNCTRMSAYSSTVPIHLSPYRGPTAGEEALIDCILLSRCSHLICTDSNLSAAALYFNPEMPCSFVNKNLD